MNRRRFVALVASAVSFAMFPLIGCSTETISAFVILIANYAAQLANYFNAGTLAMQITAIASKIAADVTSWQAGGAASDAIQALNDLEDLINQIPFVAAYAPLVDLLLGAVTGLLALLPASASSPKLRTHPGVTRRAVTPIRYPDASKKSMTRAANDLKAQWASLVQVTPVK